MYTYLKNFLSVTQLIQKLKDTGMTIDSNDTAEIALTTIEYHSFQISAYAINDRTNPASLRCSNRLDFQERHFVSPFLFSPFYKICTFQFQFFLYLLPMADYVAIGILNQQ